MVGTSWATIMNKKSLLWGCWGVNFQVAKSISFGILQCYPHFNSIHVLCKKMQRFLYAEDSHQFHVDCWRSPWRPGFALLRQASWRRAASEDWAARPEHGHSLSPRIGREEILGNPHFEVGTITGLVVWNIFFQYFSIQLGISWSQHIPTDFHSIICFLHSIYLYIFIIIYYIYICIGYFIIPTDEVHHFSEGLGSTTRPSPGRGLDGSDGQGARDHVAVGLLAPPAFKENPWMVVKQCHKPSPISPCL